MASSAPFARPRFDISAHATLQLSRAGVARFRILASSSALSLDGQTAPHLQ
jgi:hypothetical protein